MSFSTKRFIFPSDLVECDQWIVWKETKRDGKWTKIPIDPHDTDEMAKSNEPSTWTTFEKAEELAQKSDKHGLGFVFTEDDPFVGIDLDDVRDPQNGEVDEDARFIVETMNSYTELSPSSTGYHIIAKGEMPSGRSRSGNIEMYDSGRFFTMTANHVDGSPQEAKVRTQQLKIVHQGFLAKEKPEKKTMEGWNKTTPDDAVTLPKHSVLAKAKNSGNGEKFTDFYNGDWESYSYESQSEADLAFCCMLAFWCGGDRKLMDEIFRESGMYRDKWDRSHSADGSTYGEMTIEKAVSGTTDFYTGDRDKA